MLQKAITFSLTGLAGVSAVKVKDKTSEDFLAAQPVAVQPTSKHLAELLKGLRGFSEQEPFNSKKGLFDSESPFFESTQTVHEQPQPLPKTEDLFGGDWDKIVASLGQVQQPTEDVENLDRESARPQDPLAIAASLPQPPQPTAEVRLSVGKTRKMGKDNEYLIKFNGRNVWAKKDSLEKCFNVKFDGSKDSVPGGTVECVLRKCADRPEFRRQWQEFRLSKAEFVVNPEDQNEYVLVSNPEDNDEYNCSEKFSEQDAKDFVYPVLTSFKYRKDIGDEEYLLEFNNQSVRVTKAALEKFFKTKFSNGRSVFSMGFSNAKSRKVRAVNIQKYLGDYAGRVESNLKQHWQELRLATHDFVEKDQTDGDYCGLKEWSRQLDPTLADIQDLGYPVLKTIRYNEKKHWEYEFHYDPKIPAMCQALGVTASDEIFTANSSLSMVTLRFSELKKLGWRKCVSWFKICGARSDLQKAIKRAHFLQQEVVEVVDNKQKEIDHPVEVEQKRDDTKADDHGDRGAIGFFSSMGHHLHKKISSKKNALLEKLKLA